MSPTLHTQQLTIGYRKPRHTDSIVARDISLSLQQGQLVCLLGPNGAGKSTLMRTIAGMQSPLEGRVMMGNDSMASLTPRQLATRLSLVLTDRPNIGLLNGYSLVSLGRHPYTNWTGRLSRYDKAVIRWAVDAVGASDLAERPVMELSDGQRQKLMIARALAQECDLILLDEPTAFLDLPRRAEIMQLLRHLAASLGRAILLSTHDLDLALRSADTLWLMANGQVQVGTPEDLVLSGAFEKAFIGEGVTFDRTTGAFEVAHPIGQYITVQGEGVPYMWTCRALQRMGFIVGSNGHVPDQHIIIIGDEDHPTWQLQQQGQQTVYHSIGQLVAALQPQAATTR